MINLDYEELDDLVKEKNISLNKLLRICGDNFIRVYIYVLATKFKLNKVDAFHNHESTSEVMIDREYLYIDCGSIDDFAGKNHHDERVLRFQYLKSDDYPNSYLNPNDAWVDTDLSKQRLYIHKNDIQKIFGMTDVDNKTEINSNEAIRRNCR